MESIWKGTREINWVCELVKEAVALKNQVEVKNIEIWEYCMMNLITGHKKFYKNQKIKGFTGLYFRDKSNFFAIYPTLNGPMMYFGGKEYILHSNLHIAFEKDGKNRKFVIEEYNICIQYQESRYLNFDVWSTEADVDIFYQIYSSYKKESYYEKFTLGPN